MLGAAGAILFREITHLLARALTGHESIVEGARHLPLWATIALPAVGGFAGGWIARRFVRGHGTMGIAQIMEVVTVGRRTVRFRQSLARTLSSLLVIATGGSEGREGPIIQMSAASASATARRLRVSPDRAQILVACGMAAGVAGAYNTPISATLFVMELIVGSFAMAMFGPVVVSAAVSTVATRAVLGDAPLYNVPPFHITSAGDFLAFLPVGVLAGIGAVFFMRSLRLAKRVFHGTGWRDEYRMLVAGLGVGLIGVRLPEVWGNGFEGTNLLLQGGASVALVLLLCAGKVVATSLTIGSGGVGGVFTPALMVGATLGTVVGMGAQAALPQLSAPVSCYTLLGMGGILAATTRAPLLSVIMMFELSDAPSILLPMMIVSGVAIASARVFERSSIYVEELRESGVHWTGTPQSTALSSLTAGQVLRRDVPTIPPTLSLEAIVGAFLMTRHTELSVVDGEGRFAGLVDLHDLKELIRSGDLSAPAIAQDLLHEVPLACPDESLADVNLKFGVRDLDLIPVVDSLDTRKYLGVVTRHDVLVAFDREVLGRSALSARVSHVSPDSHDLTHFEVPEGHRLASIDLPPDLEGQTLVSSRLRQAHPMTVLAISRLESDGTIRRFVPAPDDVLRRGDRLIVLAPDTTLEALGLSVGR